MHRIPIIFVLLLLAAPMRAQEFNCQVSVIAPTIQSTPKRVWQSLENAIKEFYNQRRFTDLNYSPEERIEINILLTVNEQPSMERFSCNMQVIYARPVFGSDYNSPVIDLVDRDVTFTFLENTQIEFSPDRHINNLSSILGFYAYFILGLDGDSFSPMGGTDFYTIAQQVVSNAQSSPEPGWKAFEDQTNRYWLIDNQLQAVFRPLRQCIYDYHRLGMDTMTEDAPSARATIASSIDRLKTVHQAKPSSYNLQVFFNAKYNELVEIYKPAPPQEKSKLFNTLQIIDPGHINQYQNMMKGS